MCHLQSAISVFICNSAYVLAMSVCSRLLWNLHKVGIQYHIYIVIVLKGGFNFKKVCKYH